jgi:hypothetical protein
MLLRASLALGYIPMSWRYVRVVFIPKPGKPLFHVKSLQPIRLMPFILKTPEKLLDRHIRGGALVEKPHHRNQFCLQGRYVYRNSSLPCCSQTGKVLET